MVPASKEPSSAVAVCGAISLLVHGGPTIPNTGVVWKIMPVAGNQTSVANTTSAAR
jgi:hypothetical protein